jgi:hypothetical protein
MDDRQKAGPDEANANDGGVQKRFRLDLSAALAAAAQVRLGFEGVRQRMMGVDLTNDMRALEIRLFDLEEMLVGLLARGTKLTASNEQGAAPVEPSAAATKQIH